MPNDHASFVTSETALAQDLSMKELMLMADGVEIAANKIKAENTAKAHLSRFASFERWASNQGIPSLPVSPYVVALYVDALDRQGKSLSTIRAHVSTIAILHKENGLINPCLNHELKTFLAYKRRQRSDEQPRQARALSEADVMQVLLNLPTPRLGRGGRQETEDAARNRAKIDRAILLTMVQAGLRRGEAGTLQWGNIQPAVDGSGRLALHSTNVARRGQYAIVAVKSDCVRSLDAIRPWNTLPTDRVFGLSGQQLARRLRAMCDSAGLDTSRITGQTPRLSMAHIMTNNGAPAHVILRQGRSEMAGVTHSYLTSPQASEALRYM